MRLATENTSGLHRLRHAVAAGLLLAVALTGGCAQMDKLKARVGAHFGRHPAAPVAPAAKPPAAVTTTRVPDRSLAQILNGELQRGHYAEGEEQLRQYLQRHPGDRPAQAVLRQLTVDPKKALGEASQVYVVRSGDSYSTLADRFLHDSSLFLILARYNGASNPSILQIGQKLRMPLASVTDLAGPDDSAAAATPGAPEPGAPVIVVTAASDATLAKAARLQQESLALLDEGRQSQALVRLDEALRIDPGLGAPGEGAAVRQKLLAALHQRAIVLYRDQQLDQAIALWDRVLAIDPGYERAVVYRTRALELKRRLRQF